MTQQSPPGDYTYRFSVSTDPGNADAGLTKEFTFTQTLIDPCLAATVSVPANSDGMYTVTDDDYFYRFDPQPGATPSYCQIVGDFGYNVALGSPANFYVEQTPGGGFGILLNR